MKPCKMCGSRLYLESSTEDVCQDCERDIDLFKCKALLELLGIKYDFIDYKKSTVYNSEGSEIRLDDDSGKLTFNGYCSATIDFDKDGKLEKIDIWGD